MSDLRIELADNPTDFEPGDAVNGRVSWRLDQPATLLELRLFWFTRGKGTEDAGVVSRLKFEQPLPQETRTFRFQLPEAPYSFSGRLISLVWAMELVAYPSKEVARQEVVVAPGGREVHLDQVPSTESARVFFSH
jgi:hypothetical protein